MSDGCNLPGCKGHQVWMCAKKPVPLPPPGPNDLSVQLHDTYWTVTRFNPWDGTAWRRSYGSMYEALDAWWHFRLKANWK